MEILAQSKRLVLRRPMSGDEAAYLSLLRESASFHAPWVAAPAPGLDPFGAETFHNYLASDDGTRCLRIMIFRREASDAEPEPLTLVGGINVNEIARGVFHSAYLGYWLGAPFTGQGYMREALGLAVAHAFKSQVEGGLGLHRVEANIMPHNAASLAVAQALGFQKEGLSPRYLKIAGQWQDHERWALLADA
jgi:ribosomal-protein-alanine N-acetyltransferase